MATAGKTAPLAPAGKTRFDTADRGRIRAAILRYMEAHRIGVPTLQARIAEAADRSIDLIPLKTLQRFLAGASRTNDAFLIPCHRFASGLPDYGGPEEAAPDTLAQLIGRFFGAGQTAAPPSAAADLRGRYEVWATRRHTGGFRVVTEPDKYPVPYATLRISDTASAGARAAAESVVNPDRLDSFKTGDADTRHQWEGGLLSFGTGSFVLLRNNLTRLPKCYGLSPTPRGAYEGYAIETPFLVPDAGRGAAISPLNLEFLPARGGSQK